jgi:LPS O-antigen subunit length determinant protein (WzzB/FepE family)
MSELIAGYEPTEARANAISFNELVKEFWRGRGVLVICIVAAIMAGLGIVLLSIPQYSAQLKIAPAESNFSQATNSTAQSFVSIITGGSQQYDDYAHFLDLLHSVRLATELENRYHVMNTLLSRSTRYACVAPADFGGSGCLSD